MNTPTKRVTKYIADKSNVASAFSTIRSERFIAVDCEGVKLSRKGELTVLAVATRTNAFVFDVLKLGQVLFDDGLRDILEDQAIEMLMFDCRQDSDSLWHQFKVKIAGVLDVQLLEVMYRRNNSTPSPTKNYRSNKRSARVDDVEDIHGYTRCLELYLESQTRLLVIKELGRLEMDRARDIWKQRPLPCMLVEYCAVDVLGLFDLYDKLKQSDDDLPLLRTASERYADMWRAKEERSFDQFEQHAFLPLDIIPENRTLGFPDPTTKCTKCNRMFPHDEFSQIQLRQGVQKCRVCKKVKLRNDVQKNRADNWGRYDDC